MFSKWLQHKIIEFGEPLIYDICILQTVAQEAVETLVVSSRHKVDVETIEVSGRVWLVLYYLMVPLYRQCTPSADSG